MALHQPTFQLNPVYTSRNLVDGKKTDLSLGGNQCTTTAENKAFAMWWVDLKNTRRIERIRVYSRRNDKKWGNFSSTVLYNLTKPPPLPLSRESQECHIACGIGAL